MKHHDDFTKLSAPPAGVENVILYLVTFFVLIVLAFPAYWLVTTAFKYDVDTIVSPPIILPFRGTLNNFRLVLTAPDIGRFFANSVIVALTSTGLPFCWVRWRPMRWRKLILVLPCARPLCFYQDFDHAYYPPVTTAIPYFIITALGISDTHFA